MKKISVVFVMILLLVAALIGCKTTEVNVVKQSTVSEQVYTYIDIDPLVIGSTWEKIITVPYDQYTIEIYYCNPDKDAPIQFATVFVNVLGKVPAYSYMLNGRINVCRFDTTINSYKSAGDDLTDAHRAQWKADYQEYFGLSEV